MKGNILFSTIPVLWSGSCTHAVSHFICFPSAEQQLCPVPKQFVFQDEEYSPRNLKWMVYEIGQRKAVWFSYLCSETHWDLPKSLNDILQCSSPSFQDSLCKSVKSYILSNCRSFHSYPFTQPLNPVIQPLNFPSPCTKIPFKCLRLS